VRSEEVPAQSPSWKALHAALRTGELPPPRIVGV